MKLLIALLLFVPVIANDDFLWLEEVEGEQALAFVKAKSNPTVATLKSDPHFAPLEKEIRELMLAKDRLPSVYLQNGMIYNFWQSPEHVRGIWRRTSAESFRAENPVWDILLDLDRLAAEENENWVWKGANCLAPDFNVCLVELSRGGKDASVHREFDLFHRRFVAGGFELPEAKSDVSWVSGNSLYVATDFGEGSLTEAGYPRIVKFWQRGTPLSQAREIFRGAKEDLAVSAFAVHRPEGTQRFVYHALSFYESEVHWVSEEGDLVKLPIPRDAFFVGPFQGQLLFTLRSDLGVGERSFLPGTLLSMPLKSVRKQPAEALRDAKVLFTPSDKRFLVDVSATRSTLLVNVLDNVKERVLRLKNGRTEEIAVGQGLSVLSAEAGSDYFLATATDFLTPTAIYGGEKSLSLLKQSPARFFAGDLVSEQLTVKSKDGTEIPYFIVRKKGMAYDGKNPTLLYGYGGFEVSMSPWYSAVTGKSWLEKGGVFAIANIRGGGEFGPRWHEAAILENKQKSYDDFIAVAEDLIQRNVTSPRHLGIQGGSNGGLLVGATFVQRPDLFNAVLCEVPLLDMFRYHRLLAGASWMAEYGNPDDPAMREIIGRYSPYQNVKADVKYPEVFFLTSTKDDRVHPGHARRMVAKMESQGHKVFYYENTEGGHGGSANIEQRILWSSLEFTYLWRKLGRE